MQAENNRKTSPGETGNYEISRIRAEKYFLQFDQEEIIRTQHIQADEDWLYVTFLHDRYRIERRTGHVERSRDDFRSVTEAGHGETLTIFDFLCHNMTSHGSEEAEAANRVPGILSGRWTTVNSLKGRPRTVGVGSGMFDGHSALFDENRAGFAAACEALGGTKVPYGDIGYEIPVWGDMSVILKFYGADDEFPPQTTILFDENTLSFIFYETAFYLAMCVLEHIAEEMRS